MVPDTKNMWLNTVYKITKYDYTNLHVIQHHQKNKQQPDTKKLQIK